MSVESDTNLLVRFLEHEGISEDELACGEV